MNRRKRERFWTPERCLNEASKYDTKIAWKRASEASYKAALDQKIIDMCSAHMRQPPKGFPRKYTLEQCISIAESFSSREAWKRGHTASYKCAEGAGWYHECVKNIPKTASNWNTIEKCQQHAKKFKTKNEWRRCCNKSYVYAHKKKWIDLCTKHMVSPNRENSIEFEIKRIVQAQYPSASSKRFKVLDHRFYAKCFEIDVYIHDIKKGIEFDGKYWHSYKALKKRFPLWPDDAVIGYHDIKDSFFKNMGVQILHIKEQDWLKDKYTEIRKILEFIRL